MCINGIDPDTTDLRPLEHWLLRNGHNLIQLLLKNIVFVVALDYVREVGNEGLDVFSDDRNGSEVVGLWKREVLRFLFIAVLFLYLLVFWLCLLLPLRPFLIRVDQPDFSRHREVPHWRVNHILVNLLLEQVLFQRNRLFPLLQRTLPHLHQVPDVELVDPRPLLCHSQNRSFCTLLLLGRRNERVSQLLLVSFWVFLPVVKFHWRLLF